MIHMFTYFPDKKNKEATFLLACLLQPQSPQFVNHGDAEILKSQKNLGKIYLNEILRHGLPLSHLCYTWDPCPPCTPCSAGRSSAPPRDTSRRRPTSWWWGRGTSPAPAPRLCSSPKLKIGYNFHPTITSAEWQVLTQIDMKRHTTLICLKMLCNIHQFAKLVPLFTAWLRAREDSLN